MVGFQLMEKVGVFFLVLHTVFKFGSSLKRDNEVYVIYTVIHASVFFRGLFRLVSGNLIPHNLGETFKFRRNADCLRTFA